MQLKGKEHLNKKDGIWYKELASSDIILLYNTRIEKDMSCKFAFKWLGLYQIYNLVKDKVT